MISRLKRQTKKRPKRQRVRRRSYRIDTAREARKLARTLLSDLARP